MTNIQKPLEMVDRILEAALNLFSNQGFGATSMRQIAEQADVSMGNIYHHFKNKKTIYQQLLDSYWSALLDPDLKLNKVFQKADFPGDLEEMASAIEEVVLSHSREILLIYVDVIEFRGENIRFFYDTMADRFKDTYGQSLEKKKQQGGISNTDPMVGVMVAARWFFYFFTIENCFGVPMHFGIDRWQAIQEFIKIVRYGVLPREGEKPDKKIT